MKFSIIIMCMLMLMVIISLEKFQINIDIKSKQNNMNTKFKQNNINKYCLGYNEIKKIKKNKIKKNGKLYEINFKGPIDGDNLSQKELKKPLLIEIA